MSAIAEPALAPPRLPRSRALDEGFEEIDRELEREGENLADARDVSNTLRFVEFRRVTSNVGDSQDARKLVAATSTYLQQAARRMVSGKTDERGPAWFELQMANETALKAVLCNATGKAPHIHELPKLLAAAAEQGIKVKLGLFDDWPDFKSMSDWRYGQGNPWRLEWLYAAYRLTLKVARGAMAEMRIGLSMPQVPGPSISRASIARTASSATS